jgi:hypothetical protein
MDRKPLLGIAVPLRGFSMSVTIFYFHSNILVLDKRHDGDIGELSPALAYESWRKGYTKLVRKLNGRLARA